MLSFFLLHWMIINYRAQRVVTITILVVVVYVNLRVNRRKPVIWEISHVVNVELSCWPEAASLVHVCVSVVWCASYCTYDNMCPQPGHVADYLIADSPASSCHYGNLAILSGHHWQRQKRTHRY